MKQLRWLALLSLVVLLFAYAARHVSGNGGPPFSDGTLSGSYILGAVGSHPTGGAYDFAGVITFDGAGNLTGNVQGVHVDGSGAPAPCAASISGTYSVASDGSLTASIIGPLKEDCAIVITVTFVGVTVHSGHEFVLAGDANNLGRTVLIQGFQQ